MQQEDKYREDWEKEAPLLSSLRGQQPHEPPEGYFDGLPDQIMSQIRDLNTPKNPELGEISAMPTGSPRPKFWTVQRISIAAAIALLLGSGVFFLTRDFNKVLPQGQPDEETFVSAEEVLDAKLDAFSEDELLEAIDIEDISDEEMAEIMGDEALAAVEEETFSQSFGEELPDLDDIDLSELEIEFEDLDDFLMED